MIFTVLGAVAELERSLIVERVRAGLRNARAKGKKLGRPRKLTSPEVIGRMRSQGLAGGPLAGHRCKPCHGMGRCCKGWQGPFKNPTAVQP